jgi:hypothetical protein
MRKQPLLGEAFVCLLLVIPLALAGQQSTVHYDLKQYELPYLKRQTLELGFNLQSNKTNYFDQLNENDPRENSSSSFNTSFSPSYSFYLNTPKLQTSQSVYGGFLDYHTSSAKTPDEESKRKEFSPSIYYFSENRLYLKEKFFIEADMEFNNQHRKNKYEYKSFTDTDTLEYSTNQTGTQNTANILIPIMAGWGRIERVEDARLAIYILDDLKKSGRLTKDLSDEEIFRLAQFISTLQNERLFDDREKKIWEIRQLDSFMVANAFVEQADAIFFTLLNDNWDYASGPIRENGFRISAGVFPEFFKSTYMNEQETFEFPPDTTYSTFDETENKTLGIAAGLSLLYELPINLYWQFTAGNNFRVGRYNQVFSTNYDGIGDTTDHSENLISDNIYIGFGYYPNSRTSIRFSANETLSYQKNDYESTTQDSKSYRLMTSINIDVGYYISSQLRFYLTGGLSSTISERTSIETEDISKYKYFNPSLSASLVYKIL